TLIEQAGGSATFTYTVKATETGFTDSAWGVTGTITVSNPNDWEDVTVNVADAIDGGVGCTVVGGASLLVPHSGSATATYSCSPASGVAFNNTATATWNSATTFTSAG